MTPPTEKDSNNHAALLATVQARFEANPHRHPGIAWANVEARLRQQPQKLLALNAMETSGGEPDVVQSDDAPADTYLFMDCSAQSPQRRSICYDRKGEEARNKKGVFPAGNALDMAAAMGIELLNEEQYRRLQSVGEFDTKTSSWIATPDAIRQLGGALFCDRRYNTVFTYHNGADSFYAARGFRGLLEV